MRFGYLTWLGDPNNVLCDCGRSTHVYLADLKRKRKVSCRHPDCQYSKPVSNHPRYPEYKRYWRANKNPMRFWHWLELNQE